jgi:hypothetical protein
VFDWFPGVCLGSSAHTCTHPAAIAGSKARISDQITEPFPDPVAPAISTCVETSRSRHGNPCCHDLKWFTPGRAA